MMDIGALWADEEQRVSAEKEEEKGGGKNAVISGRLSMNILYCIIEACYLAFSSKPVICHLC